MNVFIAVRVRGGVNSKPGVRRTLDLLRLRRKHACVLLKKDESTRGMLRTVNDYVAWGEPTDETVKLLVSKRGRLSGNRRLDEAAAEDAFRKIAGGSMPADAGIVPYFRLSPPSKGYRGGIKRAFKAGGNLGNMGGKINELLLRMI